MIKKTIFLSIILICILTIGCVENSPDETIENNKKPSQNKNENNETSDEDNNFDYINQYYNFGLNLPQNWNKDNTPASGFVSFSPDDTSFASITITNHGDLSHNQTLENVSEQEIKSLNSTSEEYNLTNLTVLENKSVSTNHYRLVYNYTLNGVDLKVKQVFILEKNQVFSIIFVSIEEKYDNYKNIVDQIINSITFL